MSTSLMYHTQQISGFQHRSYFYLNSRVLEEIERKDHRCPNCYSVNIKKSYLRTRYIQGVPYGLKKVYFEVDIHRYYCYKCKTVSIENLPFLPHAKARITKALARTLMELRPHMSISAISKYFNVEWHIIKNCEKSVLKKKYKHIILKNVKVIGLDEIYISRKKNSEQYITVVRDLESGAVLYVGEGKGSDALKKFSHRLKKSKSCIDAIAMDMSKAYISWAKNNLPDADIVFDHFHVIKLMNEKIDQVRRRTYKNLDDTQKELLKNNRFLFLRNIENLDMESTDKLEKLRNIFKDLGDTNIKKEELRSIYINAKNDFEAEALLKEWCMTSRATEVNELHKMANTIENHMDGILAFWRNHRLTNAHMEGFNNKIRWLIRQAYGYRDREYFYLKIFDLPKLKTTKEL
jgi:transposase